MFLTNVISAVFRPSVAALAISVGLASFSSMDGSFGAHTIKAKASPVHVCDGVFKPVCTAFSF